jgi:hypothetical protein
MTEPLHELLDSANRAGVLLAVPEPAVDDVSRRLQGVPPIGWGGYVSGLSAPLVVAAVEEHLA